MLCENNYNYNNSVCRSWCDANLTQIPFKRQSQNFQVNFETKSKIL